MNCNQIALDFLGDVRDKERVDRALNGVDYVVHAAAMKQVEASGIIQLNALKPIFQEHKISLTLALEIMLKRLLRFRLTKPLAR